MNILLSKTNWIAEDWHQQLFWTVAVVSSLLLVILAVYSLFTEENGQSETPENQPFIQVDARSVLIFFTTFGWSAAIISHFDNPLQKSLLYGVTIGIGIALFTAKHRPWHLFKQKSKDMLEGTGEVLQSIPPHRAGIGKVSLANMRRMPAEAKAVTQGRELPVGAPVRVVGMLDDETLLVEPLEDQTHPKPGAGIYPDKK